MFTIFFILSILLAIAHILIKKSPVVETLLKYFLVVDCGLAPIFGFTGHVFLSDMVAESIGWATSSPFQVELGFASLGFGLLGILCIWIKGTFWIAAGLGYSIFLLGAAYVHIGEIMNKGNYSAGNAGEVLILDVLTPLTLYVLLYLHFVKRRKKFPQFN